MDKKLFVLAGTLLLSSTAAMAAGAGKEEAPKLAPCPSSYPFKDEVDYHAPEQQVRIRGIEGNHLNPDVENLIKGQSTSSVSGDLRFILGYIPNHHRALTALMRLALRDRTDTPPEIGAYTVRCWMHRATVFNPKDGKAAMLYGIYLAGNGMNTEAIEALETAKELLPDNSEINYNLGLLYFNIKDYKTSLQYANRAYALGFPLPGLRKKLAGVGFKVD